MVSTEMIEDVDQAVGYAPAGWATWPTPNDDAAWRTCHERLRATAQRRS